jgi:hypothetical protein
VHMTSVEVILEVWESSHKDLPSRQARLQYSRVSIFSLWTSFINCCRSLAERPIFIEVCSHAKREHAHTHNAPCHVYAHVMTLRGVSPCMYESVH